MPMPQAKTYWDPYSVHGKEIDLSHIEPFDIECITPDQNVRRVRIVFSPHVFTRGAVQEDAKNQIDFDNRVFCEARYEDSKALRDILSNLPKSRVFQTWEERNYLVLSLAPTSGEEPYHIFFELKKNGGKRNKHVLLRVESAYRASDTPYVPPARPNSIRFKMLVQNVYLGRTVKFARR